MAIEKLSIRSAFSKVNIVGSNFHDQFFANIAKVLSVT